LSELPETYDERLSREDFDKRGARDRDNVLALALARLAGVELPESLLRPITGNMPHIPTTGGDDGVALAALKARIAELEGELAGKATQAAQEPPAAAPEPPPPAAVTVAPPPAVSPPEPPQEPAERAPTNREIRDMKRADLVTLAGQRGLPVTGSRADLIGRLLKKNGTNGT
jgi:hypothetical protein